MIKLTAEQEYVVRENVKDLRGGAVTQNVVPKVGEKIPSGVERHDFPSLAIEKVPQVIEFFIAKDQIVLLSPTNTAADVIKKPCGFMSAIGPKRTSLVALHMSAIGG